MQFLFIGFILLFNLKKQLRSVILITTFMFCLHLVMAVIFHHTFSFFSVIFSLYTSCMFYPLEPTIVQYSINLFVCHCVQCFICVCLAFMCLFVFFTSLHASLTFMCWYSEKSVCSFFLIYVSRNGNVHDAKYCFKHWAMDDTVTASCIKTASTGFSDIYMCCFYKFAEFEWTYYLFFGWNCKHDFKWSTEGLKKRWKCYVKSLFAGYPHLSLYRLIILQQELPYPRLVTRLND